MIRLALLLLASLVTSTDAPPLSAASETGDIAVAITGLRSDEGSVIVLLYDGPQGFPMKPDKAIRGTTVPISGGKAAARLPDVEPGRYAISVLHDENGNGKIDTNFLGIPTEGVGASNNAKGKMGPPKYKDAAFDAGSGTVVQRIKLQYI